MRWPPSESAGWPAVNIHMAALAETSQRSTLAADFDRALDMLAGIKERTDSS
jgi:hypothetical protein